jgi:hypothetical protein
MTARKIFILHPTMVHVIAVKHHVRASLFFEDGRIVNIDRVACYLYWILSLIAFDLSPGNLPCKHFWKSDDRASRYGSARGPGRKRLPPQQTIHTRLPSRLSAHPSVPDGSILTYHHPSPRRSRTFKGVPFGIAAIRSPDAEVGFVLSAKNASGGLVFAT